MKGKNMTHLKQDNRSKILMLLHDTPLSRKDIAEQLNLTPAAVTILTNEMIEEKWLIQKGSEGTGTVGRRKIILGINEKFKKVIGVHIDKNSYQIGLATLDYQLILEENYEITHQDAQLLLDEIIQKINEILDNEKISLEDIFGIGVGIVGVVQNNISEHAYDLWSKPVPIAKILTKAFDKPVVVENNIRAIAEAELVKAPIGANDNMIYMSYGPSIGSALILERNLYLGNNHKAGDLGHIKLPNYSRACSCGKMGCLVTEVSQTVIEDELKMTLKELLREYISGTDYVLKAVNERMELLAFVLNNQISFLDPSVLIINGEMFENEKVFEYFKQQIDSNVKVIPSQVKERSLAGTSVILRREFYAKGAL